MLGTRVIVHVDLDAFYAAVEQIRVGVPREEPLAVQQWGSMIAVNYPARKFGVKRGDSVEEVKNKCPACHLVHVETIGSATEDRSTSKVSLERYRKASVKVMTIFARFCPKVERASIDEAFIDLTEMVLELLKDDNTQQSTRLSESQFNTVDGSELQPHVHSFDLMLIVGAKLCSEIRAAVLEELGYTCSAGIGPNKMLAKIASAKNKPNKQTLIPYHSIQHMMSQISLRDIRGLGGKLGTEIEKTTSAKTAVDLQQYTHAELCAKFGEKDGAWLYSACRGTNDDAVKPNLRPKSLLAFKSFSAVNEASVLKKWLHILCNELAERIRTDAAALNRCPHSLVVYHRGDLRSNNSKQWSRAGEGTISRSCRMPSVPHRLPDSETLFQAAWNCLSRLKLFPCTRVAVGAADMRDTQRAGTSIESFFSAVTAAVGCFGSVGEAADVHGLDDLDSREEAEKLGGADVVGELAESKEQHEIQETRELQEAQTQQAHQESEVQDKATSEVNCAKCGCAFHKLEEAQVHQDEHLARELQEELDASTGNVGRISSCRSSGSKRKAISAGIGRFFKRAATR